MRAALCDEEVRSICDKKNAKGFTPLDYAVAINSEKIIDTLSTYHAEHLANNHICPKHAVRLNGNSRYAFASARVTSDAITQ